MPEEVPADVARLLRECIDGYEHLEALLVLFRHRSQALTPARIAIALNVPEALAAKATQELARAGLIRVEHVQDGPEYRYPSGDARVAQSVERLMAHYETNRIAVMQLINTNAIERVRRSAARTFADAFVLGRKKNDG